MTKVRIKDLATELGVIYADLVSQAKEEFDFDIKGPMSLIDEEQASRIRDWMYAKGTQFKIEESRVASKVIRRRRIHVPQETTVEPTTTQASGDSPAEAAAAASLSEVKQPEPAKVTAAEMEAAAKQATTDDKKRKKAFQALTVVEQDPVAAPEVREAPVFETPREQRELRSPEEIAKAALEQEKVQGPVQETGTAAKPVGRREVIEIRQTGRPKQFGRKKVATKKGKKTEITTPKASKRVIKISDSISIGDLAKRMGVKVNEIISKAMGMGLMVTINQSIDADTAAILASDFNYEIDNVAVDAEEMLVEERSQEAGELEARPPVVTVMGHVDHGKTSLLDSIRKTNVSDAESGGITQHIGAYDVRHKKGHIVFLDTPGHEAFTAMRARGTSVTDIVVLVVAADDGVMPQTKESINHSRAAKVPIIVAINKIDKPEANSERIKQELTEFELVSEAWGGDTIYVEVSAKTGQGIDELLDMLILQSEVMELRANRKCAAKGAIIESKLDRGRGAVATVLVQEGTLRVGDVVVCGSQSGKIRSLINDRGERIREATPSTPVEVVGLSGVVDVGDILHVLTDEKKAKQIVEARQQRQRQVATEGSGKVSLDDLYGQIEKGEVKGLNVIIKGDVMGSVEAIAEALNKIRDERVNISIVHSGVGGISEGDIMLATASQALVIGFNIRPDATVQQLAEKENVEIRFYSVIYDVVEDVKKALVGLLGTKAVETVTGHVAIKQVFNISKVGTIGGGEVTDGKITRDSKVRLLRDNVVIYEGQLASLKRFKDDAKEVKSGLECGLSIENYNDIKVDDVIEAYVVDHVQQEL